MKEQCDNKSYPIEFCKNELNNAFCMIYKNITCLAYIRYLRTHKLYKINEANETIS